MKLVQLQAITLLTTLNLQYFADQQGGDQAPSQPNETNPGGQQPTNLTGTGDQQPPEEKTFTQEDVNNIVARESKKATEKLLKSLGFDDIKNAKDGLEKLKEWQESQKTEQEKQNDRLQTLETENSNLAQENDSLKTQLAALKAGVNADSIEDVVVLAQKYVSDDVDIDKAIQQVIEKYPHFKSQQEQQQQEEQNKPQFTTGQHQTGSNGTMTREQFAKMKYEDRVKFQKENPSLFKQLFS